MEDSLLNVRQVILDLTKERGEGKTICPTEAARRLDPENWRRHLGAVRKAAIELVDAGEIIMTRKGKPVDDPRKAKGVIRLGRAASGVGGADGT